MFKEIKTSRILFIHLIRRLLPPVLLAVLAADLLYLYFVGGWYDPNKFIEYSEVTLLFILVILSISYFIYLIIETSKRMTNTFFTSVWNHIAGLIDSLLKRNLR